MRFKPFYGQNTKQAEMDSWAFPLTELIDVQVGNTKQHNPDTQVAA